MATWDAGAESAHEVDFRLAQDSFVTMFWRSALLDETVMWLRSHAYDVVEFEASAWDSAAAMFIDLARELDFPDYFGRNLDALNDCMRDVAAGGYGWNPNAAGLVIVLKGFDAFAEVDRRTAQMMLDLLARRARGAILIGNRMVCLVQSDDARLAFDPVGAMPVMWNDAEWLDSKRGL